MHSLNKRYVTASMLSAVILIVLSGCTAKIRRQVTGRNSGSKYPSVKVAFCFIECPCARRCLWNFDPKVLSVLDLDAKINVLAKGFEWVEGPVWSVENEALLFQIFQPIKSIAIKRARA
ncbi:hypothetical protein P4S73_10270 [Paraglaciecola sp. Hal342]